MAKPCLRVSHYTLQLHTMPPFLKRAAGTERPRVLHADTALLAEAVLVLLSVESSPDSLWTDACGADLGQHEWQ